MNPIFDQMRAAWESGGSVALHTAAESAAQQGAAETDIYAAVERLLLSLRESGLDDEADDRINDVLDRLTGWCHPSCHIHTTPSATASERTAPVPSARGESRTKTVELLSTSMQRSSDNEHGTSAENHPIDKRRETLTVRPDSRSLLVLLLSVAQTALQKKEDELLDLIAVQGLTVREAAAQLSIPYTTAHDRYRAALEKIRVAIRNDPAFHFLRDLLTE